MKKRTPPPTKYQSTGVSMPDWINDAPAETEIDTNPDGSQFIPIFHVEKKLDRLDPFWGTDNFKFQFLKSVSGMTFCDASIEVVVSYAGRTRKLVGAVTIVIPADTDFEDPFMNKNFSATCKSEAIKNAVKAIGRAFGQDLNDRGIILVPAASPVKGKTKPPAVKKDPDEKTQRIFNQEYEKGSGLVDVLKAMYNIEYTGNKTITNAEG